MPFHLKIVSLKKTLFNGETSSVYICGDQGEYELLPYHYALIGGLLPSEIKIAGHDNVRVKTGAVLFSENKCTIIVEQES